MIAVGLVPIGGAIPGFVTATLVPQHGWQLLFLIGGIVPIVIALAAMFGLPELIKFMAFHESHRGKMERLIAEIRPDFQVPRQREVRDRGREAVSRVQSGVSVPATGSRSSRRCCGSCSRST